MQEYKLCPFCNKAVEAETDSCTFCGGFLKFTKPVTVSPRQAAAINNPESTVIRPAKEISPNSINAVQLLSLLTVLLYCTSHYAIGRGIVNVGTMLLLLFSTMVFFAGTWISFATLLRKFNGTADIARPLVNMNFYFLAAFLLVLPLGYATAFSGGGPVLFVLQMLMLGAVLAGTVLWIIAAVRMTGSSNEYIPLPRMGKVTLASMAGHVVVKLTERVSQPGVIPPIIIEVLTILLTFAPFIFLAWILGECRSRVVTFQIENKS